MKMIFYIFGNLYGRLFGWSALQHFHHALINLSLHSLGYGNSYNESFTGEDWFIKKVLAPTNPVTVIDIGANVGNYSKKILKETSASIFAVEPNTASYLKLRELPNRVTKLNLAISDYDGQGELNFRTDYDERATLDNRLKLRNSSSVKVSTLDTVIKNNKIRNIDFVKIDTEGFEKEVITGFGNLRPKFIQFEFNIDHLHRQITLLEISKLLPNYTLYRLLPHGWLKINPEKFLNNIFMFCNIVAVREE